MHRRNFDNDLSDQAYLLPRWMPVFLSCPQIHAFRLLQALQCSVAILALTNNYSNATSTLASEDPASYASRAWRGYGGGRRPRRKLTAKSCQHRTQFDRPRNPTRSSSYPSKTGPHGLRRCHYRPGLWICFREGGAPGARSSRSHHPPSFASMPSSTYESAVRSANSKQSQTNVPHGRKF